MEIETKIFDVEKVRKILKKKNIKPYKICDITDFLFDESHFHAKGITLTLGKGTKSGQIKTKKFSVEIPDKDDLIQIGEFLERKDFSLCTFRLRLVDTVPYVTFKGPKKTKKGVKSRLEIETRVGSLSAMMAIFLESGAILEKSFSRIREIYHLPDYPRAEVVIDTFDSAHDTIQYAEVEAQSYSQLIQIVEKFFKIDAASISDTGVTNIQDKKTRDFISQKLNILERLLEE